MKRVVISILLAIVFASIPVFAEASEANLNGPGTEVTSANPAEAPSPQMRRHRRRRMYRIGRRRHYRRMRMMRRGRRR